MTDEELEKLANLIVSKLGERNPDVALPTVPFHPQPYPYPWMQPTPYPYPYTPLWSLSS